MGKQILALLRQQPFRPFRIHMTDGSIYEIRYPERVEVRASVVELKRPNPAAPGGLAMHTLLALGHVVQLEPLLADEPAIVEARGGLNP